MGLNQLINVTVPPSNGLGPSVDVSTMTAGKTIEITGNYRGRVVLLGSHDGTSFVPIAIFDSGAGAQAYKQTISITARFVKVDRQTISDVALTMAITSQTTTLNNFIGLAALGPAANGPQASVDLWTVVAPTGLNVGFTVFGIGSLAGSAVLEGSSDNSSFNPIGSFESSPLRLDSLSFTPFVSPSNVRFIRVNISGKIRSSLTITIGGEQNVAGGSSSGLIPLKFSGVYIQSSVLFLADSGQANSGGMVEYTTAQNYPMPACTVSKLFVNPSFNTHATSFVVTVFKNSVATAVTVTIPPASTVVVFDLTHSVVFAAGDVLSLRIDTVGDLISSAGFAATLQALPV